GRRSPARAGRTARGVPRSPALRPSGLRTSTRLPLDDSINDRSLSQQLAGGVRDADITVDDLLASLEDASLGEDILADRGREVVDVDADGGAEVFRGHDLGGGPGGHRASGIDEGGDGAAVEGVGEGAVLLLIAHLEPGVAFVRL